MKIIRTFAIAALTAAALATTPAVAGAMTRQECLDARIETAESFLSYANERAAAGDYASYWQWFGYYAYAMSYTRFCK
jgi:hypothetical protein